MSLLMAPTVKNSQMLTEIYFIFLKTPQIKNEMFSIPNLDLSEKRGKVVIKKDKFQDFCANKTIQNYQTNQI